MIRVALYARISVGDSKIPAIENQLANLRALAQREGYDIVAEFKDDGISAYSGKTRPGFLDLVNGIQAEKFDIICAVAEDRFTRSNAEKQGLMADCVKHHVTWHTLAGGRVDPSTAEGGLLATITGAIAEYESAVKAERIKRSVADRLAKGKDLGGPRPFGYERDRATVFEPEANALRTAYKMILDGQSVYSVAKLFTVDGYKRDRAPESAWRPQTVRSILLRPRNAGRLVVRGVEYETDKIDAIVDWETFSAVRSILENPARAPRRGPKPMRWAAMGTVRCGVCGNYLNLSGANKRGYRFLRCAPDGRPTDTIGLKHPHMLAEKLDVELRMMVFVKVLTTHDKKIDTSDSQLAILRHDLAELQRQRDVAQELAFAPGANLVQAKRKIAELGVQLDEAQQKLDEAMATDVAGVAVEKANAAMNAMAAQGVVGDDSYPEEWHSYWESLSIDDQRALIRATLPNARLMPMTKRGENRVRSDGLVNQPVTR